MKAEAITTKDVEILNENYCNLLMSLRNDVVPLVDAFEMEDEQLRSALGCYDGRAYERLYNEAQKSPLNKLQV